MPAVQACSKWLQIQRQSQNLFNTKCRYLALPFCGMYVLSSLLMVQGDINIHTRSHFVLWFVDLQDSLESGKCYYLNSLNALLAGIDFHYIIMAYSAQCSMPIFFIRNTELF